MHISYPLYKEHLLSLKSGSSDTHKTKIGLGRITATLLDKSQNGWKARNMWTRLARTPFQKLSSYSFLSNVTTFGNVFFALGFLGRGKMKKKKRKETTHNSAFFLSETRKSHLLPWFLLFLQWIIFWVSQRPFTMWSLIVQVWCSERTTMECPDSPGWGECCVLGHSGLHLQEALLGGGCDWVLQLDAGCQ